LNHIEKLGLILHVLQALTNDQFHFVFFLGAEENQLLLDLGLDKHHNFEAWHASLVLIHPNEIVRCLIVFRDSLDTLLFNEESCEIKSGKLGHFELCHGCLFDFSDGYLDLHPVVITEEEILDRVVPDKLDLEGVEEASETFLDVGALSSELLR